MMLLKQVWDNIKHGSITILFYRMNLSRFIIMPVVRRNWRCLIRAVRVFMRDFRWRRLLNGCIWAINRCVPCMNWPYPRWSMSRVFAILSGQPDCYKKPKSSGSGQYGCPWNQSHRAEGAVTALRELFHFSYWLVKHAKGNKPDASIAFSAGALPQNPASGSKTLRFG